MKTALAMTIAAAVAAAALAGPPQRNDGTAWPTLHGDLMRSGFYPHWPRGDLKIAWRKELWKELTGPRAETIVGGGLAFMGTYAGRMYAWNAETGEEKWVLQTGGPIGHSPMLDGGVLYFGSMDRKLYAVTAADGKVKWTFEAGEGLWTSPAVHEGLVLLGARDGVFYAVRAADGTLAWRFQTGAPILGTASISDDGSRVLFGSEDMHIYCLAVADGKLLWKSRKLPGLSLRDYYPVLAGGLALVTTAPVHEFHWTLTTHQEMLIKRTGYTGADNRYIPAAPGDVEKEQDFILAHLKEHPTEQTFFAFRIADGSEPWTAPILYSGGLHNVQTPPCVNLATGDVFIFLRTAYGVWDGGGEVRPYTSPGKLDLRTGRVQLVNHGYPSKEPGRPPGAKDAPWMTFNYIGDETQTLSCSPEYLFANHQGYIGSLHFKTLLTKNLYGKRDTYGGFYGAGNFGWEKDGGREKARAAGQPYGLVNEWHGPARAIVSVVGPYVYFPVGSQVICLKGEAK
ncbi:MAG: PQQ-like beta-propeller repeat protein [Planctomycetota bacterium]|nr:PQQ-like beta-propeller repeat protein [Planctomycetota bacterium]